MHHDIILLNCGFKDLNPLLCGTESCVKGYGFGPAAREYFLIHYVVSGKGIFKRNGECYELKRGNLFIIRPHEMTYYEADSIDPWTYIWIGFEINNEKILKQCKFIKKDAVYALSCEHIFKSMLKADDIKEKEIYLLNKLFELFFVMAEDESIETHKMPEIYVRKAQNYINTSYVNNITVESIAKFLGIDRRYFCSIFKKYIGKSPKQYIVDLRMEKAAELLVEHGYTPGEAAINTGYQDIFNFSKMFKKKYGVAPINYKKEALFSEK